MISQIYKYRDELKYIVHQRDLVLLKERLKLLMEPDKNQKGDSYRIRSLYFDDYYDSAFYENDVGSDNRKKFRIRVYDNTIEKIILEIKYKYKGKTRKESCSINKEQLQHIVYGNLPFECDYPKPLLLLYTETLLHKMKPKIIIEYERSAFVFPLGNIRVTFDRNISYSKEIDNFLDDKINLIPLLPLNKHVLEIKYDEFLPDFIAQVLELGDMQKTAFSKYYLSRLSTEGENENEH